VASTGSFLGLPTSLPNSDDFVQAALDRHVICVPGRFSDVNPVKRADLVDAAA
jgi:hypothetical protein